MIGKKRSKMRLGRVIFGFFLAMMAVFGLVGGTLVTEKNVYADPEASESSENSGGTNESSSGSSDASASLTGDGCQSSLGAIGWLVCPTTGAIAQGVDFLYGLIKDFLVINPVEMEDGAPIYEIWKYFRGLTNIVFIIFLLVVIYSQITGMGVSNYGIKKALPKLIVAAVLVNLSFLLCSLVVDVSNIVGEGFRGLFDTIANSAVVSDGGTTTSEMHLKNAEMYSAVAGGTALTIAGTVIAFETGAIWMLIPVLLGAIVAVVTGLITIALRQAVVALLIMISPLAVVAYMLPNTDNLFKQWKKLLTQMLVFYPMFSLLFGAANLAGFAIIMSAKDGFGVLLGTAVQIFPLFFSWKLMQMSGTFLGTVNAKMRSITTKPLAGTRAWADSRRMAAKQKNLAMGHPTTPSLRLMQFMANRRVERETDTAEHATRVKNRGLAYRAERRYKDGVPTRRGVEAYEGQARDMEYQRAVMRDQNNMEKGLGQLLAVNPESVAEKAKLRAKKAQLDELDAKNVKAADALHFEQARGEKIAYENAEGFYKRTEAAIGAHMDDLHGYNRDEFGNRVANPNYKFNLTPGSTEAAEAATRYETMKNIMEGNVQDVQFAAAGAAHAYDTQQKIVATRNQKYFDMVPPTVNVEHRLDELTDRPDAADHIDEILPGIRILNQRGDTDLALKQVNKILNSEQGVELGTHASQALASFLMFEVKDQDPWMRRFGKYINLETARAYNKNERQVMRVTYDEYVKGYHEGEVNLISEDNPTGRMYAKKGMRELMEGTPLDGIERTALDNYNSSLIEAYTGADGKLDVDGYLNKRDEIEKAIEPQFISANLKYLSGSEQITAAVKSKTGFAAKQKDDGTYEMVPIWEDDKFKKQFAGNVDRVKKWYQDKSMQYLLAQTPSQLLGLRSDYRDPLMEHLAANYEDNKMEGWSDEAIEERAEIMKELAELQTQFGDLSTDEAKAEYEKAVASLKRKMAGAQFRQLLDSKGKLNQIYRTRRSGAANNAKDWVREWLDLDNEVLITMKLEDDKRKMKALMKEERRKKGLNGAPEGDVPSDSDNAGRIYDEVTMAGFVSDIDDMWQNLKEEDDDIFYEESVDYIERNLGKESYILAEYKRFRKDDPYADSHMLKEYLNDLLNDPDNYY